MKSANKYFLALALIFSLQTAYSQIPKSLKNAAKRTEKRAERKVEKNVNKKMDKAIDDAFDEKKKEKKKKEENTPADSTKKTSFYFKRNEINLV
jgi:hypothetical protein